MLKTLGRAAQLCSLAWLLHLHVLWSDGCWRRKGRPCLDGCMAQWMCLCVGRPTCALCGRACSVQMSMMRAWSVSCRLLLHLQASHCRVMLGGLLWGCETQ